MKQSLVLATNNKHKVREIQSVLAGMDYKIRTLEEFPDIPEVVEDANTLEENALKKAREIYEATGILCLADDTGLEVDYIAGKPGVFSSRFAGENATYALNNSKLLSMLDGVPWEKRQAQFRCVMAIVDKDVEITLEGICRGYILDELIGSEGFGYDPLFFLPEYNQTFAEMPLSLKNKISHRGLALNKLKLYFKNSA